MFINQNYSLYMYHVCKTSGFTAAAFFPNTIFLRCFSQVFKVLLNFFKKIFKLFLQTADFGDSVILVLLDLTVAFDTLDHNI